MDNRPIGVFDSGLGGLTAVKELEQALLGLSSAKDIGEEGDAIRDTLLAKMSELRLACDEAETVTAKKYWPFPTYGDLLFGVK